jgi:hypothetical protein
MQNLGRFLYILGFLRVILFGKNFKKKIQNTEIWPLFYSTKNAKKIGPKNLKKSF